MGKETNDLKRERAECSQMDSADRKKLRLLAEDADRTYTQLGELVHLSAPAVREPDGLRQKGKKQRDCER